jgi:DNA polymerase I
MAQVWRQLTLGLGTFILIDGYSIAFRQYFALPAARFIAPNGELTNASFGFMRTLFGVLASDPDYVAVAVDRGYSARQRLYRAYKANRLNGNSQLRTQLFRIEELLGLMGVPVLQFRGAEADDVIGSVVHRIQREHLRLRVLTGDHDLLQLVDHAVEVQILGKQGVYTVERVHKEFGVWPWQIADLKALVGDESDNIPGVLGIGIKTAQKLLLQYQSLEEIYQHLPDIPINVRSRLITGERSAFLSKRLAQISRKYSVRFRLHECSAGRYDYEGVSLIFRQLGFDRLLNRPPLVS